MNKNNGMYQVATLQALMLGYTKNVVTVGELAKHGDLGLGTFENVNGEMIVLDGTVYKADNTGNIALADQTEGVPFASVGWMNGGKKFQLNNIENMDQLKQALNNAIEEDFGLNSMYILRIDGCFTKVRARSELGQISQHIELSEILKNNQKDFDFDNIKGTMVCLYFPDFMDGINAAGWHLHFVSEDRKRGGHVYELAFEQASAERVKLSNIDIQLPTDAAFDTYSLKSVSNDDVKKVEQ